MTERRLVATIPAKGEEAWRAYVTKGSDGSLKCECCGCGIGDEPYVEIALHRQDGEFSTARLHRHYCESCGEVEIAARVRDNFGLQIMKT